MVIGKTDFIKQIGASQVSPQPPQRVGGRTNVSNDKKPTLIERLQAYDNNDGNVYDRINSMGDGQLHPHYAERKFDRMF